MTAYFGGLHFWWPKITGRLYPDGWARFAAFLMFFGFNLTFFPQFILGYLGMPRRYHAYPPEFQLLNVCLVRGRLDPRHRLSVAARLSAVVTALRSAGRRQSLAGLRTGMADALAAAGREFRTCARGARGLRLR